MKNCLFFVIALLLPTTALPDYDKGLAAYTDGDFQTALREFTAASRKQAQAQFAVGVMHFHGQGVAQDYAEAVRWFYKAAEQGMAEAQNSLGIVLLDGQGVAQDNKEAARWFRKAAEQGIANAQINLGNMYANGNGVDQDYAEAVRWFHKAAVQGMAEAQNSLGNMYANGNGVDQDDGEAVQWFRKAAEQGMAAAQNNLGNMYANGRGLNQDYPYAMYFWVQSANQIEDINARRSARNSITNLLPKFARKRITAHRANLYSGPEINAAVIKRLSSRYEVFHLDSQDGWHYVLLNKGPLSLPEDLIIGWIQPTDIGNIEAEPASRTPAPPPR